MFSLDYLNAQPVVIRDWQKLQIILVGCGGTGSWLAPALARLARSLVDGGKNVDLVLVDPDKVELKNIYRQNFAQHEVGLNKAQCLAIRYGTAWGVEIQAIASPFNNLFVDLPVNQSTLCVIIGCVDNAAARREIAEALSYNDSSLLPSVWWLDCGNHEVSGQVLIGSSNAAPWFDEALGWCKNLPSPALQHPELLQAKIEEIAELSCAEIQQRNAQSLTVNQQVAAIAADYVVRLLSRSLNRFATYFDLASGTMRSLYVTPEAIARKVGEIANL